MCKIKNTLMCSNFIVKFHSQNLSSSLIKLCNRYVSKGFNIRIIFSFVLDFSFSQILYGLLNYFLRYSTRDFNSNAGCILAERLPPEKLVCLIFSISKMCYQKEISEHFRYVSVCSHFESINVA